MSAYLKDIARAPRSELVEVNIGEQELNERLTKAVEKGIISGEQWFRRPQRWYEMPAFINPYKTPYTELQILIDNSSALSQRLRKTTKIFYGLGIGDSEGVPVQWDLVQDSYAEVYAVDVMRDFIEGFIQSLTNLLADYPGSRIMFMGNNTLFEKLQKRDRRPQGTKYDRSTLICFGNTIGNFDQNEILKIFRRNSEPADLLLLGYQLDTNPKALLYQYEGNERFAHLIRDSLHEGSLTVKDEWWDKFREKGKMVWRYNPELKTIESWSNGVLVFRSKKYDPDELATFAEGYGFTLLEQFTRSDCGVSLFERG